MFNNNNNNSSSSSMSSGITNQISCNRNFTNGDSKQFDETVEHIISACPVLAKEQYIKRCDRVCSATF
jgi:hypothetical protein